MTEVSRQESAYLQMSFIIKKKAEPRVLIIDHFLQQLVLIYGNSATNIFLQGVNHIALISTGKLFLKQAHDPR